MLAVGHAEALLALQSSAFVVPLLVDFTMQLANPIWEDDEELMNEPAKANKYVLFIPLVFCCHRVYESG